MPAYREKETLFHPVMLFLNEPNRYRFVQLQRGEPDEVYSPESMDEHVEVVSRTTSTPRSYRSTVSDTYHKVTAHF